MHQAPVLNTTAHHAADGQTGLEFKPVLSLCLGWFEIYLLTYVMNRVHSRQWRPAIKMLWLYKI
jgi:hypothetical protein